MSLEPIKRKYTPAEPWSRCEQAYAAKLIAHIESTEAEVSLRSADALAQICFGVITGEGPTVAGRIHFSRTIDVDDTALCARILMAAGRSGYPVTRIEAERLSDICAGAGERNDGGRFEKLFVKAVAHHVISVSNLEVPPRQFALASATPIESWTSGMIIDGSVSRWLSTRMRKLAPRDPAAREITKLICHREPANETTLDAIIDRA